MLLNINLVFFLLLCAFLSTNNLAEAGLEGKVNKDETQIKIHDNTVQPATPLFRNKYV
jgi:hypothetical protein